jgi:hypothetical protein
MSDKYLNAALVRLKRKYGKDELVSHLNNTINELNNKSKADSNYIKKLEVESYAMQYKKALIKETELKRELFLLKQQNAKLKTENKRLLQNNVDLILKLNTINE